MDVNIQLDLNNSLGYTDNKLEVKRSSKTENTLTMEPDGLYAQAIPGKPGSTGIGYPDGYRSGNGIMSGVAMPDDHKSMHRRIVAPSIVHRIFTCTHIDGSDISLRAVDKMYPGDMYRVKDTTHGNWNYYLILKTNDTGTGVTSHSGEVAIIPITEENVN